MAINHFFTLVGITTLAVATSGCSKPPQYQDLPPTSSGTIPDESSTLRPSSALLPPRMLTKQEQIQAIANILNDQDISPSTFIVPVTNLFSAEANTDTSSKISETTDPTSLDGVPEFPESPLPSSTIQSGDLIYHITGSDDYRYPPSALFEKEEYYLTSAEELRGTIEAVCKEIKLNRSALSSPSQESIKALWENLRNNVLSSVSNINQSAAIDANAIADLIFDTAVLASVGKVEIYVKGLANQCDSGKEGCFLENKGPYQTSIQIPVYLRDENSELTATTPRTMPPKYNGAWTGNYRNHSAESVEIPALPQAHLFNRELPLLRAKSYADTIVNPIANACSISGLQQNIRILEGDVYKTDDNPRYQSVYTYLRFKE